MGLFAVVVVLAMQSPANAEDKAMHPPIKELEKLPVLPKVYEGVGPTKPAEIRSEKDAAMYFSPEDAAKLANQVDFKQQFVLLFAWRGSGQDKLGFAVAESFPEQITFSMQRGRTKDLRSHVKIFALRNNVKWTAK